MKWFQEVGFIAKGKQPGHELIFRGGGRSDLDFAITELLIKVEMH